MKSFCILCLLCNIFMKAHARDLSVLTWNTFLIPNPFKSTKQEERADLMAKKIMTLDHDVIFFQEAFLDAKRDLIIKELSSVYPYVAVPKKGDGFFQFVGSGLFIVSKYPMTVLDQVIFEDCSGSDCFASKSAIMVEISLPNDKKIQMINTHLQGWDAISVRQKQLLQIKNMMKVHAKMDVAQVLGGDLNIDGKIETEFVNSLTLMGMSSTPLVGGLDSSNGFSTSDCFDTPGGISDGELLDHLWLKLNGSEVEIHSKQVVPIIGLLGSNICPLSDHYAVEAFIKVKGDVAQHFTQIHTKNKIY